MVSLSVYGTAFTVNFAPLQDVQQMLNKSLAIILMAVVIRIILVLHVLFLL
jgi:hypothetical protein